jgi:hypothetical protein
MMKMQWKLQLASVKRMVASSARKPEKDTIVVFASDNGPDGPGVRTFAMDMQDIGSFRDPTVVRSGT